MSVTRHVAATCGRLAVLVTLAVSIPSAAAAASTSAAWTPPASLSTCAAGWSPQVVFPASSPTQASGPGAILWGAGAPFCSSSGLMIAPLDVEDAPLAARAALGAQGSRPAWSGPTVAAGTSVGQIVAGARGAGAANSQAAALSEGPASGPLATPTAIGSAAQPVAQATGYLGDVAVVSVTTVGRAPAIALRMQRYYARSFAAAVTFPIASGTVTGLAVAMDYRTDVLIAWAQNGYVFARQRLESGTWEAAQRLGTSGSHPDLQTLISDDAHAMVAWNDQGGAPHGQPRPVVVRLDISGPGVHFGAPVALDGFVEPPGTSLPTGSLRLVRLSGESVDAAWTSVSGDQHLVRAAELTLGGPLVSSQVSASGQDAVLTDLVAGPDDDVLALWSATVPGSPQRILLAARATQYGGAPHFAAPEQIASPGTYSAPVAAIDPSTDQAVAVWLKDPGGSALDLQYAIRASPVVQAARAAQSSLLALPSWPVPVALLPRSARPAPPARRPVPALVWWLLALAALMALATLTRRRLAQRSGGSPLRVPNPVTARVSSCEEITRSISP